MGALYDRFKDRHGEIEHYFKLLEAVESRLVGGERAWRSGRKRLPKVLAEDLSLKLLKATTFLVLYNVIEATIRDSIDTIWGTVANSSTPPLALRASLREAWVGAEFRRHNSFSASGATYRSAAYSILSAAADGAVPRVDFRRVGSGGNLDRRAIRDLCSQHGVLFTPPKNARAGIDLDDVKGRRNVLAHGEQTFEEIGSLYTVSDLRGIKVRVAAYLRHYVQKVEKYLQEEAFKAA